MGRRSSRRLFLVPVLLLLLLVVLLLAVPLLIPVEAFRTRAVDAVVAATGAEVELGEAKLTILPRLALSLRAGSIAGSGEALRAAQGDDYGLVSYAAELERIEVRINLLPLLQRRLAVREVQVTGPRLQVITVDGAHEAADFRLRVRDLSLTLAAPADGPTDGPPGDLIPADLSARAELTAGRLTLGGTVCTDVMAEAVLAGRVIELPRIEAGLAGGRLSAQATVDYAADPWGRLAFACEVTDAASAALLEPWVPDLAGRLDCRLGAAVSGTCSLKDAEAVRASLSLEGAVAAGEGMLRAGDWLRDVSPYLGRRQDLKDVRFTGLTHEFALRDGRYLVQDLVIEGPDTRWQGVGWVGLDGTLDLALQVKLPPGFTPDLGAWSFVAETLRDEQGRVQLDLLLSGRSERPSVGLDLARLKAGAADGGADAVQKGVGALLDKWKTK